MNMSNTLKSLTGLLLTTIMLALSGGYAVAGGLVATAKTDFAAAAWSDPSTIDNIWWTLMEGDKFLYFAEEDEDCIWNLVEVLGESGTGYFGDVYQDTSVRIILDREWVDEECVHGMDVAAVWADDEVDMDEITYDWYAQDDGQNIWYMGEDTYDGESSEGSFAAGCEGSEEGVFAEAGIVLMGTPVKGKFYQQEFLEEEAEDWGKVLNFIELDDMDCMKTKEWTPLESGHVEHKFYCTDGTTGQLVLINELKGKTVVVDLYLEGSDVPTPPAPPVGIPYPSPLPPTTADCDP